MKSTFDHEMLLKFNPSFLFGVDEVGRGPLAGPVVSCCVGTEAKNFKVFYEKVSMLGVTDSKKLSSKKRQAIIKTLGLEVSELRPGVLYHVGELFSFSIDESGPEEIDQINILQSSLTSMRRSTLKVWEKWFSLEKKILVLIDGNKKFQWSSNLKPEPVLHPVIGGDAKSLVIGLASIIAKEYRDRLMGDLHQKYPAYGFNKHAGYPTASHRKAIELFGVSDVHRKTFKGVKEFISIEEGSRA